MEICFAFTETEIGEIISKYFDIFGGNIYRNLITKKENLIPEKVIFNREKGKTTLLFKGNGKQDYVSYSSKALEIEKYNAHFGFYITFYKFFK